MFQKILIANRGEIACRIIKTAQAMGIHCVAVYSIADTNSLHVQLADSAFEIGDAPARDSYLNIANIIHAAKETGAQAIHPGYGFLSENAHFARACQNEGIVFIGPSVEAIEAMGSKKLAKQSLEQTQVPLTPGYHGNDQSDKNLLTQARAIGFPILLKAANGGGGKGMRAVHQEQDFQAALDSARRESMSSFSDDTMIIEKLVINPRHVEVQIMADSHGNVVTLFERDCSIQRRHQKIIEEAPAPGISEKLRAQMAQAACEVAKSIDYTGAGTIEFLVDTLDNFYFMEMNTRLQVEHPVTEMITGQDLVEWQLKIAAGEPLPCSQQEIKAQGHAIECRIYAEDPFNQFMPSTGSVSYLRFPKGRDVRIDTGIQLHSEITLHYDPMIAKLIVWGKNRTEALQRLTHALGHFHVGGVKTNIPFLQAICNHPKFINAELGTDFLTQETIELEHPDTKLALLMAAGFDYLQIQQQLVDPLLVDCFSWQLNGLRHWTQRYMLNGQSMETLISPINNHQFNITFNEQEHRVDCQLHGDLLSLQYGNQRVKALLSHSPHSLHLFTPSWQMTVERFNWGTVDTHASTHKGQLTAPMPATIVAILKNIGDTVKAGEGLIVLEAMKMEHTIHAPVDGILNEIFYTVGSQVSEGVELLTLADSTPANESLGT